jgi:Arc/MetJ-type ribon-helix-helix transcriptional regulator
MTDQTKTIEIPAQIADEVATRIEGTEFDSVDDYVSFALEQLLAELRRESADIDVQPIADAADERAEEASVADRLESLGYL